MPRIRSVKPEFWSDRKLARQHSRDARLLYIALWNQADEHGRVLGDPRWIKGACLPYDDDIDEKAIERLLGELAASGRVRPYVVDDDPYLFLPKLANHQRLEAAKVPSRLPAPPPAIAGPEDPPPGGAHLSEPDAGESAPRADESARDSDESALSYVAGSRGHVAGGRKQGSPVTAVGGLTRRNARTRERAPAAQPEDLLARRVIRAIPRYRAAPGWVRKHLAALARDALGAGYGSGALTRYARMVIEEERFLGHQHIPELRAALRRLELDVRLGDACPCCGQEPDDCPAASATDDRPWTEQDQAAWERTLAHLGADPDELARGA
ncbi:hypothetical protein FHS43_006216 [Streptosporangium becharense]|uniref:Uncharacterized protein n=1 Tax=Streptosporangium becharense TaxID=1816182 RepID=A0A7W9MGV8_9ACTN|nr:hypothetical protein [Streptosporangium becharense]MBB2914904.1 hypothetical protein [Streptosporangium becharense]MBB5820285.1 hypothetical protein [Streptosporangium becharense]